MVKYNELLRDKEKFQNYIDSILLKPGAKSRKRFKIPEGLESIFSVPYSLPIEEQIKEEITVLIDEYMKFNLSEYVNLYEWKTYALFKYQYAFDRYLKPELKKWVFNFLLTPACRQAGNWWRFFQRTRCKCIANRY